MLTEEERLRRWKAGESMIDSDERLRRWMAGEALYDFGFNAKVKFFCESEDEYEYMKEREGKRTYRLIRPKSKVRRWVVQHFWVLHEEIESAKEWHMSIKKGP